MRYLLLSLIWITTFSHSVKLVGRSPDGKAIYKSDELPLKIYQRISSDESAMRTLIRAEIEKTKQIPAEQIRMVSISYGEGTAFPRDVQDSDKINITLTKNIDYIGQKIVSGEKPGSLYVLKFRDIESDHSIRLRGEKLDKGELDFLLGKLSNQYFMDMMKNKEMYIVQMDIWDDIWHVDQKYIDTRREEGCYFFNIKANFEMFGTVLAMNEQSLSCIKSLLAAAPCYEWVNQKASNGKTLSTLAFYKILSKNGATFYTSNSSGPINILVKGTDRHNLEYFANRYWVDKYIEAIERDIAYRRK